MTTRITEHRAPRSGLNDTGLPRRQLSLAVVRGCCAIAFTLILAGCSRRTPDATSTAGSTNEEPVPVKVAEVKVATLQPTLELVGRIIAVPEKTAVVSPQQGGWVERLNVVEGQTVRAGDVLLEMDSRSAKVSVQRAEAVVAEKDAAVRRLKSGYLPEEIAGARQDADKAAATVEGLRNELDAIKTLLDRGEFSQVVYETKAKAFESAKAALASARERVKLLEAGTRPEMVAEAQGLLDAAKADLEQARLILNWCTITSPIDGVVVQLLARQGQYFDRAVPLATIIDQSHFFVQLRVPSQDFGKVHLGAKVNIQLSSIPGRTFSGTVARISGQADPLTGNVVVFGLIENIDDLLRPGLSCNVQVFLPEISGALAIPVAAVADNSGKTVVTVIRENKAYEMEVKTGIESHGVVQVLNELSPGDVVAIEGGYGLPNGCAVKVDPDPAASASPVN